MATAELAEPTLLELPFETSPQVDKILPALISAQAKIQPAVKDCQNSHFKSSYADLAAVYDACMPHLNGAQILVTHPLRPITGAIEVACVLWHVSGQWARSRLEMACDARRPQEIGSAITYARRYLLVSLLAIKTEDDDGEAAHGRGLGQNGHREQPRRDTPQQRAQATQTPVTNGARRQNDTGKPQTSQSETWSSWIVDFLARKNGDFLNDQAIHNVDKTKRKKELMNQYQAVNFIASELLRAGTIQSKHIEQSDNPGKRDAKKAADIVARCFAKHSDWVKELIADHFAEKVNQAAIELRMWNPDADPVEQDGSPDVPY